MGLTIGQLLGGAGVVASRQRQAEEAERVAHQNQLALEQLNRLEKMRRTSRPDIGAPPGFGDLNQFRMDVAEVAPPAATAGVSAGITPPAAPTPSAAPAPTAPTGDYYEGLYGRLKGSKTILGISPSVSAENLNALRDPNKFSTEDVARVFAIALSKGDQNTATPLYQVLRQRGVSEADLRNIQRQTKTGVGLVSKATKQEAAAAEEKRRLFELKTGRKVSTAGASEVVTPTGTAPSEFDRIAAAVKQVESGGDPNAVSPAGAIGTMQTMPGTLADPGFGVTPARNRTPQELERVGRDYLGAMIREFNGNLDHALAAYNWGPTAAKEWVARGANLAELPAETRNYIQKVKGLIGGAVEAAIPTAQAATAGVAPTTARGQVQPSNFYMGNPQAISRDMQVALQNREELRRMAMMYRDAGLSDQYDAARQQIIQLDQGLFYLSGMQGIQQLMGYNDPRLLSAVISQSTGVTTGIRPRTDNLYDIVANPGTPDESIISQGVPAEQIASYAQELFDPSVRASRTELAQFAAKEEIKGRAGLQQAMVKATADIQAAIVKGEYDTANELAKQAKGELKFDTASGKWAFVKGNDVRIIDPSEAGVVETPLGPITRAPAARQITGLNFGQ
jgi:hypothetical protein